MGKVICEICEKKCSGNVLRVGKQYFHIDCFKCHSCVRSLSTGGFFTHSVEATKKSKKSTINYYCPDCYQSSFGTKCAACGTLTDGKVVSAFGAHYHPECFRCSRCEQVFDSGEKVQWTGDELVCSRCDQIPVRTPSVPGTPSRVEKCSSCKKSIEDGQALIALDSHWHIWCFKCTECKNILHGEYLTRDGLPYCEKDYQKLFGIRCAHCTRYITGKVLQAGDNHFHPSCARCTKCGDVFADGEEMFIQGAAIWHPRCGPGPGEPFDLANHYFRPGSAPNSPYGSQFSASSQFLDHDIPIGTPDWNRVNTFSYLTAEPTQGYLRKPLEARLPASRQFHRPSHDYTFKRSNTPSEYQRAGMRMMVTQLQNEARSATPQRAKSPSMNNEEPIELSHYPSGRKPEGNTIPNIERDDFPAPPFAVTDRVKGSRDDVDNDNDTRIDPRLQREEEELSKLGTGIGKVFLETVKEREKVMAYRKANVDPRKASRSPSAKHEIPARLRYENPVHASPSRDMDRPRPWEEDAFERNTIYRNSTITRSQPLFNNYNVVSALRHVPKPGYGLTSSTMPSTKTNGHSSTYDVMDKAQSIDLSSGKSEISLVSEQIDPSKNASYSPRMNHSLSSNFRATPYSEGYNGYAGSAYNSYSPHLRSSMPNVNVMHRQHHQHSTEPARQYPYHLLITRNYRLPPDVDRCHLERHLDNSEFEYLFGMGRAEFYKVPEWKRNELKRRAKLF